MTAAIKQMLAERAKREADEKVEAAVRAKSDRRWERIATALFARIDRAAPFIDEGCPPNKWLPSSLLKLLYCVSATSERTESGRDAADTILTMLETARQRFRDGLHPNPFLDGKEAENADPS